MLKNKLGLSFGWASALVGAVVLFVPACGGTGETGGTCVANDQKACDCPGGTKGVQVCNADGRSYEACQCGSNVGGGGSGGNTSSNNGGSGGKGGGVIGACGDGTEDQGECDVGAENYCPEDCKPGSGGSGGGTTTNNCEGVVTYAGLIAGVPSQWGGHPQANGKTGYEAGIEVCKTIGADHPCEYQEVKKAEAAGELSTVAAGTSAWIHRTTPEMVNGAMSPPGPGGRCNDWVYITNHISDGEYVTFAQVGIPAYHLDNDTVYDGVDTTHTIGGDLQCGGESRAVLCCYPACVP